MRPVTEKVPKPMIPVLGKPFLQHQIELLAGAGIRRVLLLVSYLGEQIERHFGNGSAQGWELSYSYEGSPLGTGGALKNAAAQLDGEFMVLNGDTYLAIDYGAFIGAFQKSCSSACIVAYDKSSPASAKTPAGKVAGNLAVMPDGRVAAYRKRGPEGLTHVDAGVIALRKEVIEGIPAGRKCSVEEEVYPLLIRENRMRAWVTTEPFYDMGSPAGLEALEAKLA